MKRERYKHIRDSPAATRTMLEIDLKFRLQKVSNKKQTFSHFRLRLLFFGCCCGRAHEHDTAHQQVRRESNGKVGHFQRINSTHTHYVKKEFADFRVRSEILLKFKANRNYLRARLEAIRAAIIHDHNRARREEIL